MPGWAMAAWADWRLLPSIHGHDELPAMGTVFVTNTACSSKRSKMAGNRNKPDSWLHARTPGKSSAAGKSRIPMNCSFEVREGTLRAIPANRQK